MCANTHLSRAFGRLIQAQRDLDDATFGAFLAFESRHLIVAQALLEWTGDRRKAARWMMFQRHVFDGKSGYELVIDGDVDTLWDHIRAVSLMHHDSYGVY